MNSNLDIGLTHSALPVADVDRSTEFYAQYAGMQVIHRRVIFTDIDAPAADRLVSFGLTEGTSNVHPEQGTACRRFFFHNCMLELLWVHDPEEAVNL